MNKITYKFDEENNKVLEFRKVVVHKIKIIGESADPEIEIAAPFYEWQQTPAGQFIMKNAVDINWTHYLEFNSFSYIYYVVATLEAKKLTEYYLRFDNTFVK
jgi:hypothetical protein